MNKFTQMSIWLYENSLYLSLPNEDISSLAASRLGIETTTEYTKKVAAFVRGMKQHGAFDSLPDSAKTSVVYMEENPESSPRDVSLETGANPYHIRLASVYLHMENIGLFDNPNAH